MSPGCWIIWGYHRIWFHVGAKRKINPRLISNIQGPEFNIQGSKFLVLKKWAEFVRFSHTLFALPFALSAMAVASRDHRGWPGWRTFGLILAAMVCARTCAMAFNRIVDRKFDALNPRTARRHLPTGQISLGSAIVLSAFSGGGLIAASFFLNPLCFYLSPVALVVICFYSLTKRFTDYTHVLQQGGQGVPSPLDDLRP